MAPLGTSAEFGTITDTAIHVRVRKGLLYEFFRKTHYNVFYRRKAKNVALPSHFCYEKPDVQEYGDGFR